MKPKVFVIVVFFSLITFLNASAEERIISGDISLTGQNLSLVGEKAKFNEYRDIRDGIYGDFDIKYEKEKYYLDFSGKNAGRRDQRYDLSGGKWGSFKYDFSYDQLPHNFTYDARTFYSGVGGNNLTYQLPPGSTRLPNTAVRTWNTFDYSVERRNYAGGLKFDLLKPFYFDASVSHETRKGIYPIGVAGDSPGGISIELPAPIDYSTDNLKLAAGYNKNPFALSLNYLYGKFYNNNVDLNFRNPGNDNAAATTDIFTMPPDNDYYKLSFQGAAKLPWNSKFNLDLANSRTQSQTTLLTSYVDNRTAAQSNLGIQGQRGITLSSPIFNGKVDTQSYNFLLTSNPLYFLDGKTFYKYYKRENKSDQITTTDPNPSIAGVAQTTLTNDLFGYTKQSYGAELGFRLPASFYARGGYTRGEIKRGRDDIPKNYDDLYNIDVRWSGLDFMVAKVGYERLHRAADFQSPTVTGPTDDNNIENFIRRFDAAAKDRDTYKATLEFFPIENLNFNFVYKHKYTNYRDTILGLRDDYRDEFNFDFDYLIMKRVRLFGYFDYEYVKLNQFQRQFQANSGLTDPAGTTNASNFNWTVNQTEINYAYGLGADIYILPEKLTLRLQNTYVKAEGYADYTYLLGTNPLPAGRTQENIDINNWDRYQLIYYSAKVTYNLTKSLSFTGVWAYEDYTYDDAQYNGYNFVPATSGGGGALLSGAYNNPGYRANIFFLSGSYKF